MLKKYVMAVSLFCLTRAAANVCHPTVANLQVCIGHHKNGHPYLYYQDQANHYRIEGFVFDSKGRNITQAHLKKYITPVNNQLAWQTIATATHWIEQGDPKAPHLIYIIADPNDRVLPLYYQNALERPVQSGKLRIRWVIVGVINRDSEQRAQRILTNKNPLKAWLHCLSSRQSSKINDKLDNVDPAPSHLPINVRFMENNGFSNTPVTLFKTKNGKLHVVEGLIIDEMLSDVFLPKITGG